MKDGERKIESNDRHKGGRNVRTSSINCEILIFKKNICFFTASTINTGATKRRLDGREKSSEKQGTYQEWGRKGFSASRCLHNLITL